MGWGCGAGVGYRLTRGRAPQWGWTPLHRASRFGYQAVARVLVDAGADKEAKDKASERRGGMLLVAQTGFICAGGCIETATC